MKTVMLIDFATRSFLAVVNCVPNSLLFMHPLTLASLQPSTGGVVILAVSSLTS